MIQSLFILVAAQAAHAASGGTMVRPDAIQAVEVAGQQVSIEFLPADIVSITGDDPALANTPRAAARYRTAVAKATGCVLAEEWWSEDALRGKLDCSNRRLP